MKNQSTTGALNGIRIIDLTSVVMGPLATQALADLGADVIKVEPPGGDVTRYLGPGNDKLLGSHFLHLNRNKRSVVLNLKDHGGREALLKLAETADVLVFNIRPAAMERLGLDYESVRARNPRLIYVGLVGFGRHGRYANTPAFDDSIQALSGMAHALGEYTGTGPQYVPYTVADRSVGLYAFGVISAALIGRERTNRGQSIEIPMLETMAWLVMGEHLAGHTFDPPQGAYGYQRLLTPFRRPYRTKDGWMGCTVYTDDHWRKFLELIGHPRLFEDDPRIYNIASRTANIDSLYEMIENALTTRETAEWIKELTERGIPAFVVHDFSDVADDDHLDDVGFFQSHEHPVLGSITQLSCPSEWSDSSTDVRMLPPTLGEHSQEVLHELGISDYEISQLTSSEYTSASETEGNDG
ncbi:CaiB/BaiF CoA transferase family protein [Rhodococcus qingshengii]|uniref:CaiB/BaiF CoA transferase family protein n=1 Tax=Rhodococcus qingshengii TaxID=334542 RepID=UPI00211DD4F5|nr:CoA transferase [Rhodococcus qingshengii]